MKDAPKCVRLSIGLQERQTAASCWNLKLWYIHVFQHVNTNLSCVYGHDKHVKLFVVTLIYSDSCVVCMCVVCVCVWCVVCGWCVYVHVWACRLCGVFMVCVVCDVGVCVCCVCVFVCVCVCVCVCGQVIVRETKLSNFQSILVRFC